jgi:arabinogalactan oligomer/maltooligosaccharide transport system substrate-binding protein
VDVEYQDSMDYMDAVYTATMQGETFPDIYMIGSDELEEAYLYGLAAEKVSELRRNGSRSKILSQMRL